MENLIAFMLSGMVVWWAMSISRSLRDTANELKKISRTLERGRFQ